MTLPEIFLIVAFALFGLFFGSFLNVCIYRLPRGNFWSSSRSFCPHCHTTLKWYELFPLFSYISLGGRCRTCKEKISIRYPIVEATNMILWILAYIKFGISLYTFLVIVFFSLLIIISMIDIDIKEIPNALMLVILIIGAIDFANTGRLIWWEKLAGIFAMAVPFFIIGMITGGIGGGDVKLVGAAGLFLGWKLIILGSLVGIFIGAIIGVVLLITKRAGKKSEIPFGPSLAAGFVFAILIGPEILNWYIGLFS